jgi:hypothetical protein
VVRVITIWFFRRLLTASSCLYAGVHKSRMADIGRLRLICVGPQYGGACGGAVG